MPRKLNPKANDDGRECHAERGTAELLAPAQTGEDAKRWPARASPHQSGRVGDVEQQNSPSAVVDCCIRREVSGRHRQTAGMKLKQETRDERERQDRPDGTRTWIAQRSTLI